MPSSCQVAWGSRHLLATQRSSPGRDAGSEFSLQIAFRLVLGLTAGLLGMYLKSPPQKPRGKIHFVCPETGPSKCPPCGMCASLVALGQTDHLISSFSSSCSFKSFEDLLNLCLWLGKPPGELVGKLCESQAWAGSSDPCPWEPRGRLTCGIWATGLIPRLLCYLLRT
ncbi:hypothetical protein HJG60_009268 [Phyllostomus discolor]|uniref:Uncharacterized protein n=1 Tax=Phyllostomus discolor TaxID=89673 RepID=A0A834DHI0_9CHIR|nr:hypothetical protein HJG60_009268 [Phyllostomus discolor]